MSVMTDTERFARHGEKAGYSIPVIVGHVTIYIDGSGLYVADATVVGEYLATHSRKAMIATLLDSWGECFKRSVRSRPFRAGRHDDRIALDTLPSYVLAIILNQR